MNNHTCLTCIDAFCGAGGLSLGLEWAGFDIIAAFDSDPYCIETYNRNRKKFVAIVADARTLSPEALLHGTAFSRGDIDLVAGGPPCQGFSSQTRGAHLGDPRNELVLHFIRLVRALLPRFFLFENVTGFGRKRGKAFLGAIERELSEYDLVPNVFNAADYGLAQTRQRFILVGRRRDVPGPYQPPPPTVDRWRTVGEAIGDLPEPPEDGSDHPLFFNHSRSRVSPKNIERFSYVPQGGGWQDIPEHLRPPCHRRIKKGSGGWPDVFGRLEWSGQAPTITSGFDSFTRGRYGHPLQNRPLTPREAARIQGFPDWYRFYGTRNAIRHQIGNAVPPPLAEAIGRSIASCLLLSHGCSMAA